GPKRLLAANPEDLDRLRAFFSDVYARNFERPARGAYDAAEKKAWIDNSVTELLSKSFSEPVKSMWLPAGGHLVFARDNHHVGPHLIGHIHKESVLTAIDHGESVPNDVLAEYGLDDPAPTRRERNAHAPA